MDKPDTIDTVNYQLVSAFQDRIVIMAPWHTMTPAKALLHAAWLVALADPDGTEFPKILDAVRNA